MEMGLGLLGDSDVVFRRKFRWTFEVVSPDAFKTAPNWVKVAARPNLTVEETDIHFLNGWMAIPGKGKWETITVTYYDTNKGIENLFAWLTSVYDFNSPNPQMNISQSSIPGNLRKQGYAADCSLQMYDGCGKSLEKWTLGRTWPQAVNFGELDYSSSEEQTIELTLRYAFVTLTRDCGGLKPGKCEGC